MSALKNTYTILYYSLGLGGVISLYFALYQPQGSLGIGLFVLVSLCCCVALKCLIRSMRLLPGKMPFIPFISGFLFMVSGTLFDIINTVIHSPDLSLEGNPIARLFLDMSFSINQVYVIGFISQSILLTLFTILWAAFLKAYPLILKNTPKSTFWRTGISLFGGSKVSFFDLIIGKVDPFFSITSVTPIILSIYLYRWYLGFEWLKLVPISRVLVPSIICSVAAIFYIYWSHKLINEKS